MSKILAVCYFYYIKGTSNTSEASTETLHSESMEPIASNKPPEASTSVEQNTNETENSVDDEQNAIVETMDRDNCVLRQRRLAFYDNRRDTLIGMFYLFLCIKLKLRLKENFHSLANNPSKAAIIMYWLLLCKIPQKSLSYFIIILD